MEPLYTPTQFFAALEHALNYHSLDAKLSLPDFEIVALMRKEIEQHLRGMTDVQQLERMTPEERARI